MADSDKFRHAGPATPPPSYKDELWWDRTALSMFRGAMVKNLGQDVMEQGYDGVMRLALMLNQRYEPLETRARTRSILRSLFPVFIIKLFPLMFARPFPAFSAKLNAYITSVTCSWLMGPMKLFDLKAEEMEDDWGDGKSQGILVERCRFLEESGCASVCINTCKVPTQEFFIKDMGIPLSMEPNYDTFECEFKFGKRPLQQDTDEIFTTPCFQQCPSKGNLRLKHQKGDSVMSTHDFEQLCNTILKDSQYDTSIPSKQDFIDNLFRK